MDRLQQIALVAVVAFVTLGISGCIIEDNATITCDNFDAYLASCDPGCVLDYDATCESYYDASPQGGAYLDDCADCLALETGSCYDCDDDMGYSCLETLLVELGAYCDYY